MKKPKKTRQNTIQSEAEALNFFAELSGLRKHASNGFDLARLELFEVINEIMENDPLGDDYSDALTQRLKNAGQSLYNSGGMKDMHDPLVWLFIPKRLHRDIDVHWSGVGEWLG